MKKFLNTARYKDNRLEFKKDFEVPLGLFEGQVLTHL